MSVDRRGQVGGDEGYERKAAKGPANTSRQLETVCFQIYRRSDSEAVPSSRTHHLPCKIDLKLCAPVCAEVLQISAYALSSEYQPCAVLVLMSCFHHF